MSNTTTHLEPIKRLTRDIRESAITLSSSEARFLVSDYYMMQDQRIRAANQVRAMVESKEPHGILNFFADQSQTLENQVKSALEAYARGNPVGRWSMSITGIGPVIAAGLLAHIDIKKAPTVGHIWRFGGYDPTLKWLGKVGAEKLLGEVIETVAGEADDGEPDQYALTEEQISNLNEILGEGKCRLELRQLAAISLMTNRRIESFFRLGRDDKGNITRQSMLKMLAKRPWNASLKVLFWKAGESFVKVSGNKNDIYGKLYLIRKAEEQQKNEAGVYKPQADELLASKKIGKETDAYKAYSVGMLPPAHLHARAKRYAVKIFLSHWHEAAYWAEFKKAPPLPFAIAHLGHAHLLECPNLDLVK